MTEKRILKTILAIGLLAVLILSYARFQIDAQSDSVELALDFRDLTELSRLSGQSIPLLLDEVRLTGVNTIAVYEDTVLDLKLKNKAALISGLELKNLYEKDFPVGQGGFSKNEIRGGYNYILFGDPVVWERAVDNLKSRYGGEAVKPLGDRVIEIATVDLEIEMLSFGYDPEMVALIKERGFKTLAVLRNDGRIQKEGIETIVDNVLALEADTVLSLGKEVVAFAPPGANLEVSIADLTAAFKEKGVKIGFLEMVTMEGKPQLIAAARETGIKIHEVAKWRTEKSTPAEVISTIKTAVRDRSIRLVYLRFFLKGATGPSLAERNISYLSQTGEALASMGYGIGEPSSPSLAPSAVNRILTAFAILAVFAAAGLIGMDILEKNQLILFAILALLTVIILLVMGGEILLLKGAALLAACVFPVLAFNWVQGEIVKSKSGVSKYLSSAAVLIKASLITLAGGLTVAALFMSSSFLQGVDIFTGVKIAYLVPILGVAYIGNLRLKPVLSGPVSLLDEPITLKYIALGAILLAGAAFYIIRSGNASSEFVPASEIILRRTLDNLLIVRPRFKEFIVGHPAMLLAASGLFGRRTTWLLSILAAIGQISLLNTFCHTYSPLWVSLLRSFNGLLVGLVIGFASIFIYSKLFKESKDA